MFAVELPPIKAETGTGKVFTVDQSSGTLVNDEKDLKSRLNIEVNNLIPEVIFFKFYLPLL